MFPFSLCFVVVVLIDLVIGRFLVLVDGLDLLADLAVLVLVIICVVDVIVIVVIVDV